MMIQPPPGRARSRIPDGLREAAGAPALMSMSKPIHPSRQSSAEACADCARVHGCEACFAELVARFQTPLLHFLIRRIGSRHDAEDLLQETFWIAHRNLSRYKSNWRFSTWIFTIANRVAASSRRKHRQRSAVKMQIVRELPTADPREYAEQEEMRSTLWDSARKILEADAFTAIWLSYVESMPAEEIGLVIGRSANAVRILLHRARARLAKKLAEVTHE